MLEKHPPLIIGEAPSRHFDGCAPFMSPHCRRNLDRLFANPYDWQLGRIERINLLPTAQQSAGTKGDEFNKKQAVQQFVDLVTHGRLRDRKILVAGKRLAKTIFAFTPEYFAKVEWLDSIWMVIPHPTGINQWWNDDAVVKRASKRVRRFLGWP